MIPILSETAGGIVVVSAIYSAVKSHALSVPTSLKKGNEKLENVLKMCEECGDKFEEKDGRLISVTYNL
jgi:hypothetical protein